MNSTPRSALLLKPPSSPPPSAAPEYCPTLGGTGPDYIARYIQHHTYVWTTSGQSFWAYPIAVTDERLLAYAWDNGGWQLVQMALAAIDSIY
ncbi:MAG TPA: hypothetical protein VN366_06965 [Feifaniaceae bacterium]|nr:hypothetical protein [Feifaniaceae bacterium]